MALTVFYTEINQTLKIVSVIMTSKMEKRANSNLPMVCAVRQVTIYTYKHCAMYIHPG
jgi:hypothetical protein